jgi:alpha-tubulin suppressor-like RCC1 family protein
LPVNRFALPLVLLLLPACQGSASRGTHAEAPAKPVVCPEPSGPLLAGISSIHVGSAITCAVVSGRVACWGVNDEGRLGDGFDIRRDRPVFVEGLAGIAEVTHGNDSTFARSSDGAIFVWGPNRGGEFGDGSPDYHIAWTPRKIRAWGAVRQIRGGIPTCALRTDGKVECAGRPRFRSMGEDRAAPGGKPVVVEGLEDMIGVAAGSGFSCALQRGGDVFCWGMDDHGQLGDGGGEDKEGPVGVDGIERAVEIVAGGDSACARLARGGVRCWGRALAPSGLGARAPEWTIPEPIEGTEDATQIALGDRVACALMKSGEVRCWGDPSYDGQLGDGIGVARPTEARPVACIRGAIGVSVGDNHSCALLGDGTARCWGSGRYGAIGDGTAEERHVPVAVVDAVPGGPPPDRCPTGATFRRGPGDEKNLSTIAEMCESPDGKREGAYVARYSTGGLFQKGEYKAGQREGRWSSYYEHGDLLSEDLYENGEPHGVWIAYSLRHLFAFATCFERGRKMWQVTNEREARTRSCP